MQVASVLPARRDSSSRRRVIACRAAVFHLDQQQRLVEIRRTVWWFSILSKRSPPTALNWSFSIKQGSRSENLPHACVNRAREKLRHHNRNNPPAKADLACHRQRISK